MCTSVSREKYTYTGTSTDFKISIRIGLRQAMALEGMLCIFFNGHTSTHKRL